MATLISGLLQYKDLRLSVILYNSGILAERIRKLGVPIWIMEERAYNSIRLIYETHRALREMRCDILHTHRYKENVLGALARLNSGVKYQVSTVHGLCEPFTGLKSLKARLYRYCDYQVGLRRIDKIIAVSYDIRKHLVSKYPSSKLVTIHNGIDLDDQVAPKANSAILRKELGIRDKCLILGTVGRLMPVKGYDYLLRAYRILRDRHDNLGTYLCGRWPGTAIIGGFGKKIKYFQ